MAIHHVNDRPFLGPYKPATHIVVGTEQGATFRRVFHSEGRAKAFARRMNSTPGTRGIQVILLPKKVRGAL